MMILKNKLIATLLITVFGSCLLPCIVCRSIFPAFPRYNTEAASQQVYVGKSIFSSSCSKPDDVKRLNATIDWKPNVPKKGDRVEIDATLKLFEEVTSGSVTVSVNYGDVSVIAETLDLCDLVTQIKLECPLKPSDKPIHFTSKTNTIPDYLPSGKYTAKAVATDQNGKELICFSGEMTLD